MDYCPKCKQPITWQNGDGLSFNGIVQPALVCPNCLTKFDMTLKEICVDDFSQNKNDLK